MIIAGETLEKTVILGVAIPEYSAFYAPGVPVEGDQAFETFDAKPGIDGKRTRIAVDYGAEFCAATTAGRLCRRGRRSATPRPRWPLP